MRLAVSAWIGVIQATATSLNHIRLISKNLDTILEGTGTTDTKLHQVRDSFEANSECLFPSLVSGLYVTGSALHHHMSEFVLKNYNLSMNLFSASLILRLSTQTAQGKKYLAIKDRKYTLTETPCADLDMFAMKFGQFGEFGKIYPLYPRLAHCNGRAYVLDIWTKKKQVIFYRYVIDFLPNNFCKSISWSMKISNQPGFNFLKNWVVHDYSPTINVFFGDMVATLSIMHKAIFRQ